MPDLSYETYRKVDTEGIYLSYSTAPGGYHPLHWHEEIGHPDRWKKIPDPEQASHSDQLKAGTQHPHVQRYLHVYLCPYFQKAH